MVLDLLVFLCVWVYSKQKQERLRLPLDAAFKRVGKPLAQTCHRGIINRPAKTVLCFLYRSKE